MTPRNAKFAKTDRQGVWETDRERQYRTTTNNTKMPIYTAYYNAYLDFIIPKSISEYLLDENDKKNDGTQVGSWWIRWGTFYYIDEDGNKREIQNEGNKVDYKHPDDEIAIRECDDNEDDDENDGKNIDNGPDEEEDEEEEEKKVEDTKMACGCCVCGRCKGVFTHCRCPDEIISNWCYTKQEWKDYINKRFGEEKPRVRRKRIYPPGETKQ